MKRIKLYLFIFIMFSFTFLPTVVKASSFSVSASRYSVSVGSTVTVYVKGTDVTGRFNISSSDSSIFAGGESKWIENDTVAVKFTAKSAGRVNIKVSPAEGISNSAGQIIRLDSKTIQITSYVPRALSSDNYLSSLSVNGAELVPSFNKDTDSYIVDLEPGTTSITVQAEKANKYASVSGTGEISVSEGNNDINVVVTAENGSKRTYHITAIVKEYAPINLTINNSDFTVVRKESELEKPDLYESTTVEIDGNIIPAFYNKTLGYTLVGLKDVTGNVELYIYDSKNHSFTPYLALTFNKMNLVILEADETKLPKGFIKDTMTLDNQKITCYKNQELGITLIYGKSIINGSEAFYQFENTDLTIQKFNFDSYNKLQEKITLYSYVIVGLGTLILFIIVCLIISKIRSKAKLKRQKHEIEQTMNIDINQISAKDKKQDKLIKKKERALKQLEKDKKRLEKKEREKQAKLEKENKNSKEKDDNMFYL